MRSTVSISVKALFAIFVGLATVSAEAQLLATWETNVVLIQQGLAMIHSAVTNQVHGKPVGVVASCPNPASGNSGSIKLIKNLVLKNQRCEEVEYTVRSGGSPPYSEHYHLTSCLQADGTWKIV